MHKLYRTPKERLARPLWALNNRIVIGMPILRLTQIRNKKTQHVYENDLARFGGFHRSVGFTI